VREFEGEKTQLELAKSREDKVPTGSDSIEKQNKESKVERKTSERRENLWGTQVTLKWNKAQKRGKLLANGSS